MAEDHPITDAPPLPTHPGFKNLLGSPPFGRLTVLAFAGMRLTDPKRRKSRAYWLCSCSCGRTVTVRANALLTGNTASCGRCTKGQNLVTHGDSRRHATSAEYTVWANIVNRCTNPNNPSFLNYGGRGVTLCPRWRESFATFLSDMGRRPSPRHTVERKDNDGPYSPENCVWETRATQNRNKRNNRRITFCGETRCFVDWAKHLGIPYPCLRNRLYRGWSVEQAFTTPYPATAPVKRLSPSPAR